MGYLSIAIFVSLIEAYFICAALAALAPQGSRKPDSDPGPVNSLGLSSPGEKAPAPQTLQTEVVAFNLKGQKPWEALLIDDLDTVVTPSGQRLIPLLRLLKAIQVEFEEKEDIISFISAGSFKIILDLRKKEIQINGEARPVSPVIGISDLTSKKDIYLPPELLSEILMMKIEWQEQTYQFIAKTDQRLSIWKVSGGGSLLSVQTKEVASKLPELFPPAFPGGFSLDFVQMEFRPYFTGQKSSGENASSSWAAVLDSPRQTLWGNFFGGQYRVELSQPWIAWDKQTGLKRQESSIVMLNRGDWTYRFPHSEVVAGDSIFGLNDLTFPILRMTGVRFNGLTGIQDQQTMMGTSPGLTDRFLTSQVFEGTAPTGSKVELVINDRVVDSQEVLVGPYRFENVSLAPGSLNVVRIIITEPSGFQTVSEKTIFGKSIHLPKGGLAYLGGAGTNREVDTWYNRGLVGGGRVLYGLTDSLTVGTTWAAQQGFYAPNDSTVFERDERPYPHSSLHFGTQAAWLPFEQLVLSGDLSLSSGKGDQGSYNGKAYKFRSELYPRRNIQVFSQFFHYSADFFDGGNPLLRDREGYVFNGIWNITPKWSASSAMGGVWDNLKGQFQNTLRASYQNLEISSRLIPRVTLTGGVNRMSANWDDGQKILYTLKISSSPLKKVNLDAFFSEGDYLNSTTNGNFFNGLRLPGFSQYRPPDMVGSLSWQVTDGNTLGATYWKDANRDRPSIIHSYRSWKMPIQVRTELGYDLTLQKPYFDNRLEYRLGRTGGNTIGIQTTYESSQWTVSLLVNLTGLFSVSRGGMKRIADSSITPDRGGVHGRVFIDYNANGKMDPGEPGIEDIGVSVDGMNKTLTDKKGYFITPCFQSSKDRVFIDIATVPATYSPTHAMQTVNFTPGTLTEVNFGITPLHSISGVVQALKPDKTIEPLRGTRVYLTAITDDKKIVDSITGQDGSYYIGDIRPGKYYLQVDPETLPPTFVITDPKRMIEVLPAKESQELKVPPFTSIVGPEKPKGEEKPSAPRALETEPPADVKKVVLWELSKTAVPESAKIPEQK